MKAFALAGPIWAVAICVLMAMAGRASAEDRIYQQLCTITTNIADMVGAVEHTNCAVRYLTTDTAAAYLLTTARGEQYRIENLLTWFEGWYIDKIPGVLVATNDPVHPCFRTTQVQICLGQ